jgi:lambda family phage portal protein
VGIFESLKNIFKSPPQPEPRSSSGLKKRFHSADYSRYDSYDDLNLSFGDDFNALIGRKGPILRERARRLIRNFPLFTRAISAHSAFLIGKGGRFESLAVTEDGEPDEELRNIIEDSFSAWQERATVDDRSHFYDCQQLALKQTLEAGEFFCLYHIRTTGRYKGELALQFIEPDRVNSSYGTAIYRDRNVDCQQGIEYNKWTGERLAYYISPSTLSHEVQEPVRIEAERILHGFKVLRPDQLRGITAFASCLNEADNMCDYTGAELDAAKMASKWLAFVISPDPKATQNLRTSPKKQSKDEGRLEDVQNCIIEYLKTGEDIKLINPPNRVDANFDRFIKYVTRMIGAVIGIPYEIISGDYQGINYATSRMSRQDYNLILEPERFWFNNVFNMPVFRRWIRLEALKNPVVYKNYYRNPKLYEDVLWIPAGMPSPDPLKEGKAEIDSIQAGLMAPQDVILARGDDPERVLEKRAEWKKLEVLKGLKSEIDEVSTSTATNPAALAPDDEYEDEEDE